MALLKKDIPEKDGKGSSKTGYTATNEKKYERSASRQIQTNKDRTTSTSKSTVDPASSLKVKSSHSRKSR